MKAAQYPGIFLWTYSGSTGKYHHLPKGFHRCPDKTSTIPHKSFLYWISITLSFKNHSELSQWKEKKHPTLYCAYLVTITSILCNTRKALNILTTAKPRITFPPTACTRTEDKNYVPTWP